MDQSVVLITLWILSDRLVSSLLVSNRIQRNTHQWLEGCHCLSFKWQSRYNTACNVTWPEEQTPKRRHGGDKAMDHSSDAWLSIRIQKKARESAVFIVVASMGFASIQFDVDFVSRVQVEHYTVAGVVIILVRILSNGAGTHLQSTTCQEGRGVQISVL